MSLQVVGANSTFLFFRLQVLRKEQLNVMKSPGPFSSFAKAALPSLSLTYLSLRCSCVRSPGNSPGDRCHPVSDWLPRPFLPHCLPAQLHRPGGVMWQQCLHHAGHLHGERPVCHHVSEVRRSHTFKAEKESTWTRRMSPSAWIKTFYPCIESNRKHMKTHTDIVHLLQ